VRVTPRAGHDEITGYRGGTLCVRLKAPPVGGAANEALVELLADRLSLPKADVVILRGLRSRRKLVEICGIGKDEALGRLGFFPSST